MTVSVTTYLLWSALAVYYRTNLGILFQGYKGIPAVTWSELFPRPEKSIEFSSEEQEKEKEKLIDKNKAAKLDDVVESEANRGKVVGTEQESKNRGESEEEQDAVSDLQALRSKATSGVNVSWWFIVAVVRKITRLLSEKFVSESIRKFLLRFFHLSQAVFSQIDVRGHKGRRLTFMMQEVPDVLVKGEGGKNNVCCNWESF